MSNGALDVLIVGAGPVGLTMAAAAAHHGLKCRLIDKAPAPSDKSKALVVWCRTMELLASLDLAETFIRTGMKIGGGSIYAHGQRVAHLALTSDESPYGFPLMIPQNETERLLTEHLSRNGVTVERPVELVSFDEKADSVACTLRHADGRTESIDAPWVVGCDGAHSTVRHGLGIDFTGHAEQNDWMLADVRIEGSLARDEISVFWADTGILVFFPINRDRYRVIANTGLASTGALKPDPTLPEVQAMVDERGPGGLAITDPIWLANFRINERKVADYRKGRLMLAGDAAHIHSPAGGQGMNTGMQDAFNLSWKLALVQQGRGQAEPLLQSYSAERSAVGDQVLHNAERFTTMATLRNPVAQWLRNHIAPIVSSFQFVQDRIRNEWFELSINYRSSPLSGEVWPRLTGGLAAGDRLCDAPLTSVADGKTASLLEIQRGGRHTLLLLPVTDGENVISELLSIADSASKEFPDMLTSHIILKPGSTAKPAAPCWIDASERLHLAMHAHEKTLILIRPDGYIGFRSQPADGEALLSFMNRYLVRRN